jgi:hypothetical protein
MRLFPDQYSGFEGFEEWRIQSAHLGEGQECCLAIIDEVKRISWDKNPKIWIGIK